jgi:hypothetical protein
MNMTIDWKLVGKDTTSYKRWFNDKNLSYNTVWWVEEIIPDTPSDYIIAEFGNNYVALNASYLVPVQITPLEDWL